MKHELLVPAGDMASLEQAIANGADAVYLGCQNFGARKFAANFTNEELIQAVKLCHLYGVKIYVTMNTLIKDDEVPGLCHKGNDGIIKIRPIPPLVDANSLGYHPFELLNINKYLQVIYCKFRLFLNFAINYNKHNGKSYNIFSAATTVCDIRHRLPISTSQNWSR